MRDKLLSLLLMATVSACSSGAGNGYYHGSDGGTSTGTGNDAGDLGSADFAGTAMPDLVSGVDLVTPARGAGYVTVYSASYKSNGTNANLEGLAAQFLQGANSTLGCTQTIMGACTLYVCNGAMGTEASAGTIQVSGGIRLAQVNWNGSKYPTWSDATATLWNGGETLSITAAGATVPAFQTTLIAPSSAVVKVPVIVAPGTYASLQRTSPINFIWSGGDTAQFLSILSSVSGNTSYAVECSWPGTAHTGQVPAAMLALLPAGKGSISADAWNTKDVNAGGWSVHVAAASQTTTGSGDIFYELVNWQ